MAGDQRGERQAHESGEEPADWLRTTGAWLASGRVRAYPALASGTLRPIEAEDRQGRFNASQLDVVASAPFPVLPGEFPRGEQRGVAAPGAQVVPFGS